MDNLFAFGWDVFTFKYRKKTRLKTVQEKDTPRDFEEDCLTDLVITEQSARAETRLLLTSWSKLFVHGSETMLPMLQLAERYSGESIVGIEDTKFISPVQCELELEAKFLAPEEIRMHKSGAKVIMLCVTQSGRRVEIVAKPLKKPIAGGTWTGHEELIDSSLKGTLYPDLQSAESIDGSRQAGIIRGLRAPLAATNQLHTLLAPTTAVISLDLGLGIIGRLLPRDSESLFLGCKQFSLPRAEWTGIGEISCNAVHTARVSPALQKTSFSLNISDPANNSIGGGTITMGTIMTARDTIKFTAGLYRGKWTK